ncbi:hypothetical protein Q8G81_32730, partial [Klebsiella pneumoniae]
AGLYYHFSYCNQRLSPVSDVTDADNILLEESLSVCCDVGMVTFHLAQKHMFAMGNHLAKQLLSCPKA